MSDSTPPPEQIPSEIEKLLATPDAEHWAANCGWMPGTGYCANRDCSVACVFRAQRGADAARVQYYRRQRRSLSRQDIWDRAGQLFPLFVSLIETLALA